MADFSDVLFVSDFDHTMTGTDGTIPLANRRAIAAFTARGGCVTVCTGRSLPLFRSMLPQLPVNAPVILFNGGLCYDFARQAALFSYPIELDARALAADLLRRYPDVLLEVQAEEAHYCLRPDANLEEFCRLSQCPIHCLPPEKMPRSIMKLALYQDFRSPDVGQLFEITPDEETFFAEVAAYLQYPVCRGAQRRALGPAGRGYPGCPGDQGPGSPQACPAAGQKDPSRGGGLAERSLHARCGGSCLCPGGCQHRQNAVL